MLRLPSGILDSARKSLTGPSGASNKIVPISGEDEEGQENHVALIEDEEDEGMCGAGDRTLCLFGKSNPIRVLPRIGALQDSKVQNLNQK